MLIGYWKFDDTSGEVAKDISGFQNHGVYDVGIELQQRPLLVSPGYSVHMNGATQINLPLMRPGSQFTIDCWINPTNLVGFDLFASDNFTVGVRGGEWYVSINGTDYNGTSSLVANTKQYIAVAVNLFAGRIQIYLNAATDDLILVDKASVVLTNARAGQNLLGYIEEYTLSSQVLTASQISERYRVGTTPVAYEPLVYESNVVGFWRMADNSLTQTDISGQDNDITLVDSSVQKPTALNHALDYSIQNGYGYVVAPQFKAIEMWIKPTGSGRVFEMQQDVTSDIYSLSYTDLEYDLASVMGVWASMGGTSSGIDQIYVNGQVGNINDIIAHRWNYVVFVLSDLAVGELYLLSDQNGQNRMPGFLDEVALYSTAPTPEIIRKRFINGWHGVSGWRVPVNIQAEANVDSFDLYSYDWEAVTS